MADDYHFDRSKRVSTFGGTLGEYPLVDWAHADRKDGRICYSIEVGGNPLGITRGFYHRINNSNTGELVTGLTAGGKLTIRIGPRKVPDEA